MHNGIFLVFIQQPLGLTNPTAHKLGPTKSIESENKSHVIFMYSVLRMIDSVWMDIKTTVYQLFWSGAILFTIKPSNNHIGQ